MAHFAKLDVNNNVIEVIVVNNAVLMDGENEVEQKGIDFLNETLGNAKWVQCSYNENFRGKFASKGDMFDADKQMFCEKPKPGRESWVMDEKGRYKPPKPYPDFKGRKDLFYHWSEEEQDWIVFDKDKNRIPKDVV